MIFDKFVFVYYWIIGVEVTPHLSVDKEYIKD